MSDNDIVGYTYKAAFYCPFHIIDALDTGPGGAFDGWALADGAPPMSVEANLDEIAAAFVIDRRDEFSFDTDYFPKPVYEDMLDGTEECDTCGEALS